MSRDQTIRFRVSAEERDQIAARAREAGVQTSEWMRQASMFYSQVDEPEESRTDFFRRTTQP